MTRRELYISIILNAIIVFVTLYIVVRYFKPKKKPGETEYTFEPVGLKAFRQYTTDSNVFSAISCCMVLIMELYGLFKNGGEGELVVYPEWLTLLKYMSTSAVGLTFLTVMLYLGPSMGYGKMLRGTSFHTHAAGPAFAVISLCFLEDFRSISLEEAFVAVVPTLIYALFYLRQVVFVRGNYLAEHPEDEGKDDIPGWPDFYAFNRGGKWPLTVCIMLPAAFLIALGVRGLYNL